MNHFKNSLFTLFFIGIFSWTNAQSNLLQYIPSDATFVFSMNPNNLNSKVNLRQLKEYDFYNMAMMQMAGSMGAGSEEIMDVLADPETIGLEEVELNLNSVEMGFEDKQDSSQHFDQLSQGFSEQNPFLSSSYLITKLIYF